jgi:putative ABC transport system permease protein
MIGHLLLRSGVRYHLQHPLQLVLAVMGVALGVTVITAVDVATGSARRAFMLSTEAVSGRATHEIVGGPGGLADTLYPRLRQGAGLVDLAPIIDRHVTIDGLTLRLLGVDPFAEAPFRPYLASGQDALDVGVLLTRRSLLLPASVAARLGVAVGDTVIVGRAVRTGHAIVAGILEPADELAARSLDDVVLSDIATAQELADAVGTLDRIELRLAAGDTARVLGRLRAALPAGARLISTEARTGATLRMTRAFDLNLTALALVALVFGMFLIYNSVTFSLVQRRPLIGLLRALGVTPREVLVLVLAEAALIGVVATALGMISGHLLGTQLLRLVARTINDLYFAVTVTTVHLAPLTVLKAAVLGVGATIAAALPPTLEAVRTSPRAVLARSSLERRSLRASARLAAAGLLTALIAAVLLIVPSTSVFAGFAALFVLILAAALITPAATIALMAALRPALGRAGPVARMAAGGVSASLSRTAPAIAALSVAVAVGISVTVMITSFRAGVVSWLDSTLEADLYISAPGLGPDRTDALLPAGLPAQVASLDAVAGVSTYRHTMMLVDGELLRVIALDMFAAHRTAFELLGRTDDAWESFRAGAVLVSEPIAFRRGLGAGDSIMLPTDRGPAQFEVAAIFRDYASEHGVVFIDRSAYDRLWDDDGATSLAVFLVPGASSTDVLARIRALPGAAGTVSRSNVGLRDATLQVFDRTFVITGVLRLLALIVAFVGVTGALMALQLERAREFAVLRAVGLTPAQIRSLVTTQTALIGLTAATLALPLGLIMSWAMVNVVNRRSFGWSFDMQIGMEPLLQALAVGVGAAVLAGLYPAWRLSRGPRT